MQSRLCTVPRPLSRCPMETVDMSRVFRVDVLGYCRDDIFLAFRYYFNLFDIIN